MISNNAKLLSTWNSQIQHTHVCMIDTHIRKEKQSYKNFCIIIKRKSSLFIAVAALSRIYSVCLDTLDSSSTQLLSAETGRRHPTLIPMMLFFSYRSQRLHGSCTFKVRRRELRLQLLSSSSFWSPLFREEKISCKSRQTFSLNRILKKQKLQKNYTC